MCSAVHAPNKCHRWLSSLSFIIIISRSCYPLEEEGGERWETDGHSESQSQGGQGKASRRGAVGAKEKRQEVSGDEIKQVPNEL